MNNDRLKFRTPYYLPNPDGTNEFVAFAYWDAITGRPNMMVVWGNDEQCSGLRAITINEQRKHWRYKNVKKDFTIFST